MAEVENKGNLNLPLICVSHPCLQDLLEAKQAELGAQHAALQVGAGSSSW